MFLIRKRNKRKEREFLKSDDLSKCPICGNWNMWMGMGTGDEEGLVTSLTCTKCGWLCGDTTVSVLLKLKLYEITRRFGKETGQFFTDE